MRSSRVPTNANAGFILERPIQMQTCQQLLCLKPVSKTPADILLCKDFSLGRHSHFLINYQSYTCQPALHQTLTKHHTPAGSFLLVGNIPKPYP